ncbi:mucin TcMUCII, putative, partial [Trypanosoma cruzi]
MMTCRLLCALLVVALCCCCPSVCVSDKSAASSKATTTPTSTDPGSNRSGLSQSNSATGGASLETGHSDLSTTGSVANPGNGGGEGPGSTSTAGL